MNRVEQIAKIKRRLALETADNDNVIGDLLDDTLSAALEYCKISDLETNRKEQLILAIVQESTVALFNQRGNEGTTGYTTGGQGATYNMVFETMHRKLLQGGCRGWK